jgi:hypothetical protein
MHGEAILLQGLKSIFWQGRLPGETIPKGRLDQIAATLLVISGVSYLYFDMIGGVIRAVLPALGLTLLTYLPSGIAVIALICDISARLKKRETAIPIMAVIGILLVDIILSITIGRDPLTILFELYIWLPAFVMASLTQRRMQDRVINALIPVFFFATFGVLINIFVTYPWAGASYEVLGQTKQAAREWSAYSQQRLGGFTRASFTAAGQILIGYCALEYRLKSFTLRAIFWALGLVAIHYTTSKSPELAMLLLPATYFVIGRMRKTDGARRMWAANATMGLWVLLIFAGPFVAVTNGPRLFPSGVGDGVHYSSLADRVLNTWPHGIALLDWQNPVQWLIGRGLGGIGAAQILAEPQMYNPADNLAIYLFVTFGLLSILIAWLIFRGGQRSINAGARGRRDFAMIIAMLGIGAAANVIESVIPIMVLAIACVRTRSRLVETKYAT